MENGMESRTAEGFLATLGIAVFLAIILINAHGVPEYELRATAAVATASGYEPVPEDYTISGYRHGLPFVFMRRHGGSGEASMGSLPVDLKDLAVADFSQRSSAWPIDNAPMKTWNTAAFGGNLALALALAGGVFVIGRLVVARFIVSTAEEINSARRFGLQFVVCGLVFASVIGLTIGLLDHRGPEPVAFASTNVNPSTTTPRPPSEKPTDPDIRHDNSLAMELRWCEPGSFISGNRTITVERGFWIGRNEVTQAEYEQVMGENPSFCQTDPESRYAWEIVGSEDLTPSLLAFKEKQRRDMVSGLNTDQFPVETVSWENAAEFCHRLTLIERSKGCLEDGWAYQLPSEKQWEYVCRAGTSTASAYGDALSSTQANFDGSSSIGTAAEGPTLYRPTSVRSYPANNWGLFDLHGNVYEWCRDSYRQEPFSESSGSLTDMVIRGGGFMATDSECTSAARSHMQREHRSPETGFRIVLAQARR